MEVAVPASRASDLADRLRAEGCTVNITGHITGRVPEEAAG
jgi:hypothetical protein